MTTCQIPIKDVLKIIDDTYKYIKEYKLHPRPTVCQEYLDLKTERQKRKWELVNKFEKNENFMEKVNGYINQMMRLENQRCSDLEHLRWCVEVMDASDPRRNEFEVKIQELESDRYFIYGTGCQIHKKTETMETIETTEEWSE